MLTIADMGEGGVKNGQKSADILYGRPQGCQILTVWFYSANMNNKTWTTATLQSFEALGQKVPFWKPLISHSLELGFHGNGIILELKYHFQ